MYIHVPCSYCTVTPLCASVARLVSGVVWYSEAPRPRVARRRSSRPERVGVCCFKLHWWIAWRARDFRLIGDWVSTEHSGRVRPLIAPTYDTGFRLSHHHQKRSTAAPGPARRDRRRGRRRRGRPRDGAAIHQSSVCSSLVRSGGRDGSEGFTPPRVVTLCGYGVSTCDRRTGQLIIILIQQRQQSSDLFLRRPH